MDIVSNLADEKLSLLFNLQPLKHSQHNKGTSVRQTRCPENSTHLYTQRGMYRYKQALQPWTRQRSQVQLQPPPPSPSLGAESARSADPESKGRAHRLRAPGGDTSNTGRDKASVTPEAQGAIRRVWSNLNAVEGEKASVTRERQRQRGERENPNLVP